MHLESLKGCQLKIGYYPYFDYDATGGGGSTYPLQKDKGRLFLKFDPNSFHIPSINYKNTKILGLSMPPGLEIQMSLKKRKNLGVFGKTKVLASFAITRNRSE